MATHTKPLKLTRAEIKRRIDATPITRKHVRLMKKAIQELQQENAQLRYMLTIK